jgi:hypothetical protein
MATSIGGQMRKFKERNLFVILTLLLLSVSCGEGTTRRATQAEQAEHDFRTQLREDLVITGTRCSGDEEIVVNDQTYSCNEDQWIINLTNGDQPEGNTLIADLEEEDVISIPEYSYFEIQPDSPVTQEQQETLNDIWIRRDMNDEHEAVFREDAQNEENI